MPRTLSLTIEAPCEWITSNQRIHRMEVAARTKSWRRAGWEASPDWALPFEGPVHITATVWKKRRGRYDPGNWYPTAKACVDGLVGSGLLVDDDHEHVIGPDMRHGGYGENLLVLRVEELRVASTGDNSHMQH